MFSPVLALKLGVRVHKQNARNSGIHNSTTCCDDEFQHPAFTACLKNAVSGGTAASGVKTPDTKRPLTAGLKPRPPEDMAFFSKLLKPNVYRGSNVGAP